MYKTYQYPYKLFHFLLEGTLIFFTLKKKCLFIVIGVTPSSKEKWEGKKVKILRTARMVRMRVASSRRVSESEESPVYRRRLPSFVAY